MMSRLLRETFEPEGLRSESHLCPENFKEAVVEVSFDLFAKPVPKSVTNTILIFLSSFICHPDNDMVTIKNFKRLAKAFRVQTTKKICSSLSGLRV